MIFRALFLVLFTTVTAYAGSLDEARGLIKEERFEEARPLLEKLDWLLAKQMQLGVEPAYSATTSTTKRSRCLLLLGQGCGPCRLAVSCRFGQVQRSENPDPGGVCNPQ